MPLKTFNDQEVVAALNSCVDLVKWSKLPEHVRERVGALMGRCRIKPVCFMAKSGFGLRVYNDADNATVTFEGDMVEQFVQGTKSGKVDLDGYWLPCPPAVYEEKASAEEWVIVDERGSKLYCGMITSDNEDDCGVPNWRPQHARNSAIKYTDRAAADTVARNIKGVVVRA